MAEFCQWRIFVGPPLLDPLDASFYDWGQIDEGATTSFSTLTLLDANLASGATSMTVLSAAAFPTKGGVWVGPNGTGQGWEYITYTGKTSTTLTGLIREPIYKREHNGIHDEPAYVKLWWEITDNDGRFHVTREMSEELASISWNAEVGGVNFPSAALRNNHVVIVQKRTSVSDFFTNYIVGFLEAPSGKDDYQHYGEWSVRILASAGMISHFDVDSWRCGDLDMAKSGSASASQSLIGTYKERQSGDYTAANPSFEAGSVIDDKVDSLWISERVTGSNTNDPHYNMTDEENIGGLRFSQLFFNPPAGSKPRSRFIELVKLTGGMSGQSLWCANGGTSYGWLLSSSDVPNGGRVILCESEEVYTENNPESHHDALYEDTSGDFFANIRAAGGEMWLRLGELNIWHARVRWGDGYGNINHEDMDDRDWDGPTVDVPASGETMRYIWNPDPVPSDAAGYWEVGMLQNFGYDIHTDEDAPWIKVELPAIGIILRDDITATYPGTGEKLYTNDPSGPSTSGLPSSGEIKIGDEAMTYSDSDPDGLIILARHTSGTTAAVHRAEDQVLLVDPINGFATDGPPINRVKWSRFGGTIVPSDFLFKISNLPEPRTPDQEDWETDWIGMSDITGHSAMDYDTGDFTTFRVKHLIFVIRGMSVNPARPRINQIQAWADPASYTDHWLHSGEDVGDLVSLILADAHIPTSAITTTAATDPIPAGATAKGSAWSVLVDLMEYTSHRIECKLDSKFVVTPDTTWITGGFSPSYTWNKSTATSVEYMENPGGGISQIKLKWEAADKSDSGTVTYPSTPDMYGSIAEIGPFIYPSSVNALAAARRRFFQSRYPYSFVVTCATALPDIAPGEIHKVQWRMNDAMNETTRICLVTVVDQIIEEGIWTTTLTMIEIGREQY